MAKKQTKKVVAKKVVAKQDAQAGVVEFTVPEIEKSRAVLAKTMTVLDTAGWVQGAAYAPVTHEEESKSPGRRCVKSENANMEGAYCLLGAFSAAEGHKERDADEMRGVKVIKDNPPLSSALADVVPGVKKTVQVQLSLNGGGLGTVGVMAGNAVPSWNDSYTTTYESLKSKLKAVDKKLYDYKVKTLKDEPIVPEWAEGMTEKVTKGPASDDDEEDSDS